MTTQSWPAPEERFVLHSARGIQLANHQKLKRPHALAPFRPGANTQANVPTGHPARGGNATTTLVGYNVKPAKPSPPCAQ